MKCVCVYNFDMLLKSGVNWVDKKERIDCEYSIGTENIRFGGEFDRFSGCNIREDSK